VRNLRPLAAIVLVLSGGAVFGCYSPHIAQGGFACGVGKACPDGFQCANNGLCFQGDAGTFDVPPDVPVCVSPDSVKTPFCATTASVCDPACQTGCGGCGWCEIENGVATCEMGYAGTKDVGVVCDSRNAADCKPGLYCQPECGSTNGRCYRICDMADEAALCGGGSSCGVIARTTASMLPFRLCTLVDPGCDPVALTGCQTGYQCYPTGNGTECDCPGSKISGTPGCVFSRECIPGDNCVGLNPNVCLPTCTGQQDCQSGACMGTMNAKYGYCM
jgi:hypothetical protein